MRLIDADEVKRALNGNRYGAKAIEYVIDNVPTIDAVPVIRCKDCKWYEMGEEETYCRELGIFNTDPTSYCSYAKREEE